MNNNLTNVIFILDRSGSMSDLAEDTIGGYNSFIENQKNEQCETIVTTVLFDNNYEVLHDNVNIKEIKPITSKDYYARATTALNDAIGKTINNIGNKLKAMNENDRPSKILFVIITDGQENASREFNSSKIKEMITHQKEKYNWEFIYLGANVDSFSEASNLGINVHANYSANSNGVKSVYASMTDCVRGFSKGISIDNSKLNNIE